MTDLSNFAMLADLNISGMGFSKKDQGATRELAQGNDASTRLVSATKRLIDPDQLKPIEATAHKARATHTTMTLPWLDTGPRILPVALYSDYMTRMAKHQNDHDAAVTELVKSLPDLIEAARMAENGLGALFRESDYPTQEQARAAFSMKVRVSTMPNNKADFRVAMSDAVIGDIEAQIRESANESVANAMLDAYARIDSVVGNMVKRLEAFGEVKEGAKRKSSFKNAMVDNVADLAAILPALNVTNDSQLAEVANRISERLTRYSPDTLRESSGARDEVIVEARGVLDTVSDAKWSIMDHFGVRN